MDKNMANQRTSGNLIGGIILVFIGLLFLFDNFYIMDLGRFFRTFWPVILILIGAKIIYDKRKKDTAEQEDGLEPAPVEPHNASGTFTESNVFGDIKVVFDSQNFTGGSVNNVFGDIRIDLSRVKLAEECVKFYVSGVFGDLKVILPENISYRIKASAVAGDLTAFGNKREGIFPSLEHRDASYDTTKVKLFLTTSIVFGSVSISSE